MTQADVESVASLAGEAHASHAERVGQFQEELARPWSFAWVLRDAGGQPVSFVLLWRVADEFHVLDVATREGERGRGYARAALEHVIEEARASHVRHLLLEVRRSNVAAIALYRRLGFHATGVRSRYYPDDEDAIEMVLSLDIATGATLAGKDEVRLD